MRKFFILLSLSLCMSLSGQTSIGSKAVVKVLSYDMDSCMQVLLSRGEKTPYLFEGLSKIIPKFKGDTDSFWNDAQSYGNAAAYSYSTDRSSGDMYRHPATTMPLLEINALTKENFDRGILTFGPSYDRKSLVWFIDGKFHCVTNCRARVRMGYDSGKSLTWDRDIVFLNIPRFMSDVSRVEIVEGDEDFRQYIPHLRYWRGKAPVLIFVTTRSHLEE